MVLYFAFSFAPEVMRSCIPVGGVAVAYVFCRTQLNAVVKIGDRLFIRFLIIISVSAAQISLG